MSGKKKTGIRSRDKMKGKTKIIIIGAGVSGCAIARELARCEAEICVLEKEEDVCCGTSKANSAIAHAGFDAKPGSLMAKLNVEGSQGMEALSRELDFPFQQIGSLVVCTDPERVTELQELKEQGEKNGVKDLRVIGQEELRAMEPHISKDAVATLYAPTGGILCPFELNIAMAENAVQNGVNFFFEQKVREIRRHGSRTGEMTPDMAEPLPDKEGHHAYTVVTDKGSFEADIVINAAGVFAGEIHNMVSEEKVKIIPRKGEYYLLDKSAGNHVSHTVFMLPGAMGKGVLVTPTVHGNLLVGPTAHDIEDKEGTDVTAVGLSEVAEKASLSVRDIPFRTVITSFAGLRAHEAGHDFRIGELEEAPGFIDCLGIESPGLTASPAIGRYVAALVKERWELRENPGFCPERKGMIRPSQMTLEERNALIQKEPAYGNMICRCEMISEGEILEAIRRPVPARSLDGIKRRTRAGMGRCQAGFCSPRVMEILAREVPGLEMSGVTKNGPGSELITGVSKDAW